MTAPPSNPNNIALPNNVFTELRKGRLVKISNVRRVRHSATNWFSAIRPKDWSVSSAVTNGVDAIGQIGGVMGGVAGVMAVASTALAGAAFVTIVGGPQMAIAAAVIGIGLFLKSRYSNREAAHEELSKYTWNFVDNVTPDIDITANEEHLSAAAAAANTLMEDGKNQITLLGSKLRSAYDGFAKTLREIDDIYDTYKMDVQVAGTTPVQMAQLKERCKEEIQKIWEKETKAGASIHQYVRRCVHTSNYLQAPLIISMAMRYKLEAKQARMDSSWSAAVSPFGGSYTDYFDGIDLATKSRESFKKLSDILKEMDIV